MRQALGRGLDSLLPAAKKGAASNQAALVVAIAKIKANPHQPRKHFDAEQLNSLAASIKDHGLVQPIVVSYDAAAGTYELIAGERRLRAAALAGLKEIEVIIRNPGSDKKNLVLAMIENLQRVDLNPIDEALGYKRLIDEFEISQTDLSHQVGKSKSAVSNTLRLLTLPDEIQRALQTTKITEGHARALLTLTDPAARKKIFERILSENLSVRDVEDLSKKKNAKAAVAAVPEVPRENSADIRALESELQHALGTKVEIRVKKGVGAGTITLHFYNLNDFDRIVHKIRKS
jgi:ParB family chromosome partitioning protein